MPLTDLAIAMVARRIGADVYFLDKHFAQIEGVRLWPGEKGEVTVRARMRVLYHLAGLITTADLPPHVATHRSLTILLV